MKKLVCILCVFVLFTGCSNNGETGKSEHVTPTTESQPTVTLDISPTPAKKRVVKRKVIGKYTTQIIDKTPERLNNIKVASKELNNEKIKKGKVFSFNAAVGERTSGKGYEHAKIFVEDGDDVDIVDGIGGGICQLSSTLYDAAVNAKLKIVERHKHSEEVDYVQKGKDATVAYGSFDLKFKNNTNGIIIIKSIVTDEKVTVKLIKKTYQMVEE